MAETTTRPTRSTRRWREKIRPQFRTKCAEEHAPCWICNQPIDYTISDATDDEVWEPDHVHPVSTHPHLYEDPANLRASHRACNRQRSNKHHTAVDGIGTPTRVWFPTAK